MHPLAAEIPRAIPAVDSRRVGIDLCHTADVEASIAQFGDRYLTRVFTERELAYANESIPQRAERLAARFAAKEATLKVLRPIDVRPNWRSIEVMRSTHGWCDVSLTETAAAIAKAQGIEHLSLSMSHDAGIATAIVIADVVPQSTSHQESL
jgi:holo-[acyl-carrier protein] synthase